MRRTGQGVWLRRGPDGVDERMRESPFAQAQDTVKTLVRELRVRASEVFQGALPFVHGHAVAFPRHALEGALPLEAQREIVLLPEDLADIDAWVVRAFDFWRRASSSPPRAPTPSEFTRFRRQVLHPKLELVETLAARIRGEEAALARLSDEQVRILRGVVGGGRVRVSGAAGTGKTVVALEAARRLARAPGSRVLMVCFNKALASHLQSMLPSDELPGVIEAVTFHHLCRRAYDALERPYAPPSESSRDDSARFWREDAPTTLLEALAEKKLEPYDAIVVDEGQDFSRDWWSVLDECLRDREKGRLLVFHDPGQRIFDHASGGSEFPSQPSLTVNFRNTRAITEIVRKLGGVDLEPHPRAPDGEPPVVHVDDGASKTRMQLDTLVRRLIEKDALLPDQITILTPHKRENSSLQGMTHVGGEPLSDTPSDRAGKVLHATIGAFKGLEADVIILVDVDPDDPRCDRRARYVAASRARHVLHVWAKGDWLRSQW